MCSNVRYIMSVYDAVLNRILHEFSFNINIYETSLRNIIKRASGELDNELKIIFIMRLSSVHGSAPGHISHRFLRCPGMSNIRLV